MHQTHNIAWDCLSSNLTFIFDNTAVTPHRTDFFPRLPSQPKSLNHFARTVSQTIRTFSATERAKHPARYDAPSKGPLFSDSLLSRYCHLPYTSVTSKNQLIENWIDRAAPTSSYCTSHGDLADVVKVLVAENDMDQLLMLAQHPLVPLADLHYLSWGHSFGWDHVSAWALKPYIFFNVLLSKPELHADARYKSMNGYRQVIEFATMSADYDAQSYPHREFFVGSLDKWVPTEAVDPLGDMDKLHDYLKMCFRLLYRYDMLARECGLDLDWEGIVAETVSSLWKVKVEYMEVDERHYTTRFA